ncbi:MAG: hypothetical protein LBU73_05055 [Helicobacteraceae bacterium]|jgi:hypothetical protein|nr:hypothetical protein [Helicobacteraceae bacterium]
MRSETILLLGGAIISSVTGLAALMFIGERDLSWEMDALIAGIALIPAIFGAIPYINAAFNIEYDGGLKIKEEKNANS